MRYDEAIAIVEKHLQWIKNTDIDVTMPNDMDEVITAQHVIATYRNWEPVGDKFKHGELVWLSDGTHMRIAYWENGEWNDYAYFTSGLKKNIQVVFEPVYCQNMPIPPNIK